MDTLITLLIPAFFAVLLVRLLLLPMKLIGKLAAHTLCGLASLWLLNVLSYYTGIAFPVNAVTVLTAGVLGLPGIGLMAVLAVL